MAGNKQFSLLTTLTLDMLGYDKGIEQAKKKTSDLAKGTEAASKNISDSFSGLSGVFDGWLAPISGITHSITGGISAFKTMQPAVKGVGSAFASLLTGGLVGGLGIAFGALTSYLTGTVAGSNKLKEAFGYVSGAITAIMNRLKYLGSALVDIFTGKWGKVKEDLNAAFASGIFTEIKKSAEEGKAIADEEIKIKEKGMALEREESDIRNKIAKLDDQARDMDEETAAGAKQKIVYIRDEMKLENELYTKKIAHAKEEYAVAHRQNKMKGNMAGYEDLQKETDAYVKVNSLEAEFWSTKSSHQRLLGKLQSQIATENQKKLVQEEKDEEVLRKLKNESAQLDMDDLSAASSQQKERDEAEIASWKEKELEKITAVKATSEEAIKLQKELVDKLNKVAEDKSNQKTNERSINLQEKALQEQKQYDNEEKSLLKDKYDNNLSSYQEYISKMQVLQQQADQQELDDLNLKNKKGEISEKNYLERLAQIHDKYDTEQKISNKTLWQQLQDNLTSAQAKTQLYGTAINSLSGIISTMVSTGKTDFKSLVTTTLSGIQQIINGLLAKALAEQISTNSSKGLPGLAMAAVGMAAVQGMFAALPAFQEGGIIPGLSYTGDRVLVRANSGELLLNKKQQSDLFKMINGNNQNNEGGNGKVEFEIQGSKLVGVLENYGKRVRNFR